jgi:hypothetical protein
MTLGELILNIIVKINDGDVKVKSLNDSLKLSENQMKSVSSTSVSLSGALQNAGLRFDGLKAIVQILNSTFDEFIKKFNEFQNATLGLESVSKFKGIDSNTAIRTVKELDNVKSGLLSVGDASTSLKNLLSANFSLQQSVDVLNRFSDAAAFGRQGSLSFGEAVRSATEGIKNGNSILVDNCGVTKNLSVMLTEAGYSAQDMQNAATDAGVRMAIFNGIMRETNGQVGDAAKLMDTSQGAAVAFEKSMNDLKISFGQLLSSLTPVLKPISSLLSQLSNADSNIQVAAMAFISLSSAFVLLNSKIPLSIKIFSLLAAGIIALPTPIRALIGAVALLVGGIWAYNTAMTAAAATTTAATGGMNIAIGLLIVGIAGLTSSVVDFSNSNEQLKSSLQSSVSATSEYSSAIDNAITVKELSSRTTKLSAEEEQTYQNALRELAGVYPQVVSGIDSKTGALIANNQALDDAIAKQRELAGIELTAKIDENTKAIENSAKSFFTDVAQTEKLRQEVDMYQQRLDSANESIKNNNADTETNIELLKNSIIQRDAANDGLQNAQKELTALEDKNVSVLNSTSNIAGEYMKFNKIIPLLSAMEISTGKNSNAMNLLRMSIGNLGPEGFASLNKINVGLVKHSEVYKVFAQAWSEFISAVQSGNIIAYTSSFAKMQSALQTVRELSDSLSKQQTKAPAAPKTSTSHSNANQKELDIADEQIKKWKELIDVYNYLDKARGKNEASILQEIPKFLDENNLIDEQRIKIQKFSEELEKTLEDKPFTLRLSMIDDDFNKQIEEDVKVMYDKWAETALKEDGTLKRNHNPFNYYENYKKALDLRKSQIGDEITINDLLNINLSIKKEIAEIDKKAVEGKLPITDLQNRNTLQNEIKKNEKEILEIQKSQFDTFADLVQARVENIDDEFTRRNTMLDLEFAKEMQNLEEKRKAAKSEKEAENIDALKIEREKKLKKDHDALSKEQDEKQSQLLEDSFSKLMNNAQTISRIFGKAGESVANAFQKALEYTQIIKSVMESISLIKTIINLFSSAASTAAAAAPIFHDGGILSGASGADIPIIAQEGEGIISRPRMQQLSAAFGPGFFNFLNGRAALNRLGIFHSGGIVSAPARVPYQIIQVPFISETEIKGSNLKLTLARQNKIDSVRSKY